MASTEEIPERSNLWLEEKKKKSEVKPPIFDPITVVFILGLLAFTLLVFWPIISKFMFREVFFTPLVPFLMRFLVGFSLRAQESLRLIYAFSFVLSTVGIYLLVRELTRRQITPILASVIFLLPPIPVFILAFLSSGLPSEQIVSAQSFFTIMYGDGAHFLALSLIPYVIIFFSRYLTFAGTLDFSLTVILCALVLLTNRTQSINLLMILSVVAVNALLLGQARIKLRRLFFVVIFSIGLASFWYTPQFWIDTFTIFNKYVLANIKYLFPLPLILAILGLFFSFVFFGKREERSLIFISFFLFFAFLAMTVDWFLNLRSFVPNVHRLMPDLNLFGSIVVALAISSVLDKLNVTKVIGFESWSAWAKALSSLLFGFISLAILAASAYFFSPWLIRVVSSPDGFWPRLREEVISEIGHAQALVGANFRLASRGIDNWQSWLGLTITMLFVGWLVALIAREFLAEKEEGE